jgi:hypothetical protein
VVEHLHRARLERDEVRVCAGLAHGLQRFGQLDLFDALGEQECDALALELVGHLASTPS